MSILTKKEILDRMKKEEVVFNPAIDLNQLQPNSIDLRIGWSFYIPHTWKYNEKGRIAIKADYFDYQNMEEYFKLLKLKPGQFFEILPNEFIIISTLENISLNCGDLAAVLYPRSSAIRRGLQIQTGLVDCRYNGQLTIPLVNQSNHIIRVYPGERICQLQFYTLSSGLDEDEAKMHGAKEAKYVGSTPYGLEAKADPHDEIDLIKQGKIEELKEKFKIQGENNEN